MPEIAPELLLLVLLLALPEAAGEAVLEQPLAAGGFCLGHGPADGGAAGSRAGAAF